MANNARRELNRLKEALLWEGLLSSIDASDKDTVDAAIKLLTIKHNLADGAIDMDGLLEKINEISDRIIKKMEGANGIYNSRTKL